jgi:hypothetical protein
MENVLWLNHFALLPGGPELAVSYRSTSSGVGGGFTGLVVTSTTTRDTFRDGGNKVVQMAVGVLPLKAVRVTGVRVCYELTNSRSFITQIRLAQVQDPPSSATVLLDDGTNHTRVGPVCVNTTPAVQIDPNVGSLLLSLRVNFGDTSDKIVIRALGLILGPLDR